MAAHISTGNMNAPDLYQSQVIDHLGLVAGMIDELGWVEQVDQQLPKASGVTHGQALKAMILNGLGFVQRTLYLSPHFFQNKPVHRLIGEGVRAEQLDDNLLGRFLDKVYEHGLESVYSSLALKAVRLTVRLGHLDSSSLHVDGDYNSQHPPVEDSDVIHITRGYCHQSTGWGTAI